MEIKITNNQILMVLQMLSWIIFIGLCIDAGAVCVNTIITLFINPIGVENYWKGSNYLSSLYSFNNEHFIAITVFMIVVAFLKAIMFYLIIKLFHKKTVHFYQPFNLELRNFISKLSYLSLGIGLFSIFGSNYSEWLTKEGFKTADLQLLNLSGTDVWLFMAVILFVISHLVKKGIEIQIENELTI